MRLWELIGTADGAGRVFEIDPFVHVLGRVIVSIDCVCKCLEDCRVSLSEDVCLAADKRAEVLRAGADSKLSHIQYLR